MNSFIGLAIPSSIWQWLLIGLVVFSVISVLGNWMVLKGLRLEGNPDKEGYRDIKEYRAHKSDDKRGWLILMRGISLELAASLALAIFGIVEYVHTATEVAKMNPGSMPVTSVSGFVAFTVSSKIKPIDRKGTSGVANLSFFAWTQFGTPPFKNKGPGSIFLIADKYECWGDETNSTYFLNFRIFTPQEVGSIGNGRSVGELLAELDAVRLSIYFLPRDTELLGPWARLKLNGIEKTFPIPTQRLNDFAGVSSVITTNSSGEVEGNPVIMLRQTNK